MLIFKPKQTKFIEGFSLYIVKTSRFLFNASIIAFAFYFLLEQFKIGLISNYFDLNILLILAIMSGGLILAFARQDDKIVFQKNKNFIILTVFAILSGLFIYQKLQYLGSLFIIITIACVFAIFIILSINLTNYD